MMYGTIARMRFKPGTGHMMEEIAERQAGAERPPGWIGSYVYQMDKDPDEYYIVVMFESKEAYFANANSPEQHEMFMDLMQYLAGEPEWHDGHVVWQG